MNFVLKKTSVIMIIAKITIVTCKVAMFVIVVNAIITNNLHNNHNYCDQDHCYPKYYIAIIAIFASVTIIVIIIIAIIPFTASLLYICDSNYNNGYNYFNNQPF